VFGQDPTRERGQGGGIAALENDGNIAVHYGCL
jgi:hypothetical protein